MQRFDHGYWRFCFVLIGLFATSLGWDMHCAAAKQPRKILLITGEDAHHHWRLTAPALKSILQRDPRLSVDLVDQLAPLQTVPWNSYAAAVLLFKNERPDLPGRQAFDQLRQFVRQGGGLVLVHFACGAFEEFKPDYAELAGRVWFGPQPPPGGRQHDPRGPFLVHISDATHPITQAMDDFRTDDELYTCLEGNAPITVLARAKSRLDGKSYPMALVPKYGKGRVFLCTLGHDVRALETPQVGELYRRGCAWAAGLQPLAAGPKPVGDGRLASKKNIP